MTADPELLFLVTCVLIVRAMPAPMAAWSAALVFTAGLIQKYVVNT